MSEAAVTSLGKVCITPRGTYHSGAVYGRLDAVYDAGTNASYLSLKDGNSAAPADSAAWMLLAKGVGDGGTGASDNNYSDADRAKVSALPSAAPGAAGGIALIDASGGISPMPTAAQVGARPAAWMPTAAQVGARPATWMPTAAQVGARPATWVPSAAQAGASNPTLLHNADWRCAGTVVNQRGKTSYTGRGHFVDRWRDNSDAVTKTVEDGGIRFTAVRAIASGIWIAFQFVEYPRQFENQRLTYSLDAGEVTGKPNAYITIRTDKGSDITPVVPNGTVALTYEIPGQINSLLAGLYIRTMAVGDAIFVKRSKLELGSVSTMANDTPQSYQAELAKCQRFYTRLSSNGAFIGCGFALDATSALMSVPLPVPLRAGAVTPLFQDVCLVGKDHMGANVIAVAAFSGAACVAGSAGLRVTVAGGLTAGEALILYLRTAGAYIDFNADL